MVVKCIANVIVILRHLSLLGKQLQFVLFFSVLRVPGCPEEGCCVPDDSPLQVLSLSDPTQPSQSPDSMQADHSLTEAVHMEGELTAVRSVLHVLQ